MLFKVTHILNKDVYYKDVRLDFDCDVTCQANKIIFRMKHRPANIVPIINGRYILLLSYLKGNLQEISHLCHITLYERIEVQSKQLCNT